MDSEAGGQEDKSKDVTDVIDGIMRSLAVDDVDAAAEGLLWLYRYLKAKFSQLDALVDGLPREVVERDIVLHTLLEGAEKATVTFVVYALPRLSWRDTENQAELKRLKSSFTRALKKVAVRYSFVKTQDTFWVVKQGLDERALNVALRDLNSTLQEVYARARDMGIAEFIKAYKAFVGREVGEEEERELMKAVPNSVEGDLYNTCRLVKSMVESDIVFFKDRYKGEDLQRGGSQVEAEGPSGPGGGLPPECAVELRSIRVPTRELYLEELGLLMTEAWLLVNQDIKELEGLAKNAVANYLRLNPKWRREVEGFLSFAGHGIASTVKNIDAAVERAQGRH